MEWKKSTYSADSSNCVEVARADRVHVRDTKDRDGGMLTFERESWQAFVDSLKYA